MSKEILYKAKRVDKSFDFIYSFLFSTNIKIIRTSSLSEKSSNYFVLSALPKIADFISRFEFSFLCFLAFSVPFSNHTLRDFKEEISNNLLRFCILFRFRELHFLRDR